MDANQAGTLRELRQSSEALKDFDNAELLKRLEVAWREGLVDMLSGRRPPTLSALRERQLVALALHVFDAKLPTEGFVEVFFGLTAGEARALLRRANARWRNDLRAHSLASLGKVIASMGRKERVELDDTLMAFANELIRGEPSAEPVVRVEDTVGLAKVPKQTKTVLIAILKAEGHYPSTTG